MRRALIPALKIAATALVLYAVFSRIDWPQVRGILAGAELSYVIVALLLGTPVMVASGLRWRVISRYLRIDFPARFAVLSYMEGIAFNMLIPGSLGGDILRVVKLTKVYGHLRRNLMAVVLDRLSNLGILLVLCALLLPFLSGAERSSDPMLAALGGLGFLVVAGVFFVAFGFYCRRWRRNRIAREYFYLSALIARVFLHPARLGSVLVWSLLAQLPAIGMFYMAALAVGIDHLNFFQITIATALALLAGTLPLTVAGLGLREGALIWTLTFFGVDHAQAAGMAILMAVIILVQALPGLIVWLTGAARLTK